MRKIYIMCGLPGSGKTTWINKNIDKNTRIVSKDDIRSMSYGKYDFMIDDEINITSIQNLILLQYMYETDFDIIIDETHTTIEKRKEVISKIKTYMLTHKDVKIIIVWCTEIKNNLKNRMTNDRGHDLNLWSSVIENMRKSFEKPTELELPNEHSEIIKHSIGKLICQK